MKNASKKVIFAAMILMQGGQVWAAENRLPSMNTIPKMPASSLTISTNDAKPLEKLSLPNEIPIQMKDFPPLQSMHFDMAPTFQDIPVSNYVDGAKPQM